MVLETKPLVLTKQLWEQFLNSLKVSERKKETISVYRHCMEELYDFLPEGKVITEDTLEEWRSCLKECGYSESTINLRMTACNGLLKFCGMKGYTASHERLSKDDDMPEMTRSEYLQFLSAVRRMGTEQEYLLVKSLASTDIWLHELKYLTVEACGKGVVDMPDGRSSIIPPSLEREILDYAGRQGIASGPVFVTRSGNPLDRSNISRSIRGLARRTGMDPEKCCPRALHRVYQTTQDELMQRIMPIYIQTYDNLLNNEQEFVVGQF